MIKSKRTLYSFFFLSNYLFCLLFICFVILESIVTQKLNNNLLPLLFFPLLLTLFFGQYIWKGFKTIVYEENEKKLKISNPIFLKQKTVELNSFQGYVTGRTKRGRWQSYKIIWLVKENKLTIRIDEMFIKNINEVETPIKNELKYLGYQKITFKKRLLMLFKNIKIE